MAKITLSTVKRFVAKNREQLQIMCLSRFDGMIDAVSNYENPAFHPVRAPDNAGKVFKSLGRDPYMGIAGAWFVYGSRDHFRAYDENGFAGIEVSNCCGRFVLAVPEAPAPSPLLDELTGALVKARAAIALTGEPVIAGKQPRILREQIPAPLQEAVPVVKVAIVDAEKAGLINGPFWVVVLKDGQVIASTTGIQGPTGANGVARNYGFAYGVPEAEVAQVAA